MVTASLELRLLTFTLAGSTTGSREDAYEHLDRGTIPSPLRAAIQWLVSKIEEGAFSDAISGHPVRSLLWKAEAIEAAENCSDLYKAVGDRVLAFINDGDSGADHDSRNSRAFVIMAVGVAALLSFWQGNMTGPSVAFPPCYFLMLPPERAHAFEDADFDAWAKKQLMVDGSDLVGLCFVHQYLVLAKIVLVDVLGQLRSVNGGLITSRWWAFRTLFAHQQVLAERSPSLSAALAFLKPELLSGMELPPDLGTEGTICIRTAVHLECGLVEYAYGRLDRGSEQIEAAKAACGLELELTGVLGFRTVHQAQPKAQMVLVASTNRTTTNVEAMNAIFDKAQSSSSNEDILMTPKLLDVDSVKSSDGAILNELNSLQQAVVLAECLAVKRSNPDDELRGWQMAPFIEAVDSQHLSEFMVRCCCKLLRIRWECTRSRTRERSLLMMEQLVECIRNSAMCDVNERMHYAFCVNFPTLSVLLKEYAEMMVRCGLVRDALRLFEELELWNSLIDCYRLLDKKAMAVDLIKERLQHTPDDPRLWCALGDVTLNEECYFKAWEVSGRHFTRAQRSLGRCAYNKGDYGRSIEHWEAALALNSLHPDGWFALGSAALKAREVSKALDAYTRAVQLDPDNGEAWNNIAAIHMAKKRNREAFIAFREALRFKRSSWQMWENYAHVALDIRNFGQAVEALQMVLDLSQGKRCGLDCLTMLVEELELRLKSKSRKIDDQISSDLKVNGTCDTNVEEAPSTSEDIGLQESLKEEHVVDTDWLIDRVGKLLSRVVQDCQDGKVWGLLARWNWVKGDLAMCSEAALKQVRSLQGSNWQNNRESFQTFCQAALQLCEVYLETSSKTGSKKELSSAQMLLRNIMKQGDSFVEANEYLVIKSWYDKIQSLIK